MSQKIGNIKSELADKGYDFFSNYNSDLSIDEVAKSFGKLMVPDNQESTNILVPRLAHSGDLNTYSGNFGLSAFPVHTDLPQLRVPPPYLLLRCLKGYTKVVTPLIDGEYLINRIGKTTLARSLVMPRKSRSSNVSIFPIYLENGHSSILRWDELFLRPASNAGLFGFDKMRAFLLDAPRKNLCLHNYGDTLIINNHRMLHGRSNILNNYADRKIERVFLAEVA